MEQTITQLCKRLHTLEVEIQAILNLKNPGHAVLIRYEHMCKSRSEIYQKLAEKFKNI